ncbi:T9SS type A sorting domain-containing protein [Flavobacterium sp.]|uniref:T9SS type A sorting domain-containing protein n=1 Tax=Flavobacterium sp. TaxID=239 RepID=UPI003752337E
MKKLLLLFVLFFCSSVLFSQALNQPTLYNNVCDDNNDGFAAFYLAEISFEILGGLNASNFTVTHHNSLVDAQIGANPLSSPYVNMLIYVQTNFARVVNNTTTEVQILPYDLTVNQTPQATSQVLTNCIDATTSFPCWNLLSLVPQILNSSPNSIVSFHVTQVDAQSNTNAIVNPNCYISSVGAPIQPPVFYLITDMVSGCSSVGIVEMVFVDCGTTCESVLNLSVSNIESTTALLDWTYSPTALEYEITTFVNGVSSGQTYFADNSPFLLTGLNCNAGVYTVNIRAICSATDVSEWSVLTITPIPCNQSGTPINLTQCGDTGSQVCFNLEMNNSFIIGSLNPSQYTITYHATEADAINDVNPLSSPYCITILSQMIFARLENNTSQSYEVFPFLLIVEQNSSNVLTLSNMDQCDDNNDGSVVFNLTTIQAQITSTNTLQYYTSLANAQNMVSPILNPVTFTVANTITNTPIFVREIISNSCDSLYTFNARAFVICNTAFNCNQANSLCSALGVPFNNTINGTTNGFAGCLGSTPNPTWFYLPISTAGSINLLITQSNTPTGVGNQDVDYIIYGPFNDPLTPCSSPLNPSTIVSCSYSGAAVETATIPNALPGQYYLIMTTNFSNQSGYITISQTSGSTGTINCSGLLLNAFLDSNNNGTQQSGEPNFPLGQFHYEVNDNTVIHNIISPTGTYGIYDINASNSYDLSYSINSSYASNYNVTTSSYSNINIIAGSGMTVYNFPVTVAQTYNDLAVTIIPVSAPRPGFTYENKIIYTNLGNQTVTSGTLTFTKDANVTISSLTPSATATTSTGFTHNFTNLLPFETRMFTVSMQVPNIPVVNINQLLTNSATIIPLTGDIVPENNYSSTTQIVIGSYDPNDKMESHGERILHSSFTSNDYLYYTIRFENSGTASAINVRVNDVLDSQLDQTSIRMVAASHPYVMDRVGNNLTWKFDNIQLPVSVENTSIGKGYVMFKVKPNAGYAVGDIIPNTASIYFDFNPAIVTNTFNTEFVTTLAINEFENGDFVFYPNPTSDFVTISLKNNSDAINSVVVYDVLGKLIMTVKPNSTAVSETIDLSSVNSGLYFIEVITENNLKVVKKLIVK